MSALQRFIHLSIVISSLVFIPRMVNAGQETDIGRAMAVIENAKYAPFANQSDTESGDKASCISALVYGLRKIGFDCPYKDFKVYFANLITQAATLEIGKTTTSDKGIILFSKTHFVALYRDVNDNRSVDLSDEIIHAYFEPLRITSLAHWLDNDSSRKIYYIDLANGITCPQ